MNKIVKNIYYTLTIGLSVFFCIAVYFAKKSTLKNFVDYSLILTYILLGLCVVAALVLSISAMVNKPKAALMSGIGVVVMLVLILIGYSIDDHQVTPHFAEYGVKTAKMSGIIGGSLIATWIILGLAVLLAMYAAVADFLKRMF